MIGCPFAKIPSGLDSHPGSLLGQSVIIENRPSGRQELFGTIAQRLNLKHEFHHTASKQCILGFEPLK
jgi:hypothetical protein